MSDYLDLIFFAILAWCLFMLHRNEWVHRERMKAIDKGDGLFDRLPPYEVMMRKFWVWDVNKFIQESDNG